MESQPETTQGCFSVQPRSLGLILFSKHIRRVVAWLANKTCLIPGAYCPIMTQTGARGVSTALAKESVVPENSGEAKGKALEKMKVQGFLF